MAMKLCMTACWSSRSSLLAGLLLCLLACTPLAAQAQSGLGIKFGTDFNTFAKNDRLVSGYYSDFYISGIYKHYFRGGAVELGSGIRVKGSPGGFNLPLVSQDFNDNNATAVTAWDFEAKVGPRIFRWLIPKFGARMGYQFRREGFIKEDPDNEGLDINGFYAALPLGISGDLPTSFGTTGLALYYEWGLNDVISGQGLDNGGKRRAITLEIHVLFAFDPEWSQKYPPLWDKKRRK